MYVERLAAKLLKKFLARMRNIGLRVFIYNLNLPTKTKRRVSNLLFNVISDLFLIDWLTDQMDLPEGLDRNLIRVLTYRIGIEKNFEVLNRIEEVNGLSLRDFQRAINEKMRLLHREPPIKRIALKYSYPEFFVRRLLKLLGREKTERLLASMNSRLPYTWLCVDTVKYDRDYVISLLEDEGFEVYPDEDFYDVVRIVRMPKRIEKSRAYRAGMFIIAEKASIAATHALNPDDGDVILDMCAAPGIKLICTAFKMNSGRIIAVDISKNRMERLKRLVKRYNIASRIHIETRILDSRKLRAEDIGAVDKIIVDAECSSSGIIPKSPDVKLRISKARVLELSRLQRELLRRALELCQELHGEFVVYSVCSLLPEEGEYVVLNAIRDSPFVLDTLDFGAPAYIPEAGRRFFPHIHKTIGFFISRLRFQ